jgi:hypothetical protein
MTRRSNPENAIQRAIVDYLRAVLPSSHRVVAIPNGSRRTATGRASNGVPGLSPGFPDLMIIAPGGKVYLIEVKAPKGRLSPEQIDWETWAFDYAIPRCVARSIEDVRRFLRTYDVGTREAA